MYSCTEISSAAAISMGKLITDKVSVADKSSYLGLPRISRFLAKGNLGDEAVHARGYAAAKRA